MTCRFCGLLMRRTSSWIETTGAVTDHFLCDRCSSRSEVTWEPGNRIETKEESIP